VGLIIWILVQLAVMPETMILQWIFLGKQTLCQLSYSRSEQEEL